MNAFDPEAEQRRLAEALAPYTARDEIDAVLDGAEPAVVQEIEALIGIDDLSAVHRLHARADIRAFLEQRLEPSEFITAAVERKHLQHQCAAIRPDQRLALEP